MEIFKLKSSPHLLCSETPKMRTKGLDSNPEYPAAATENRRAMQNNNRSNGEMDVCMCVYVRRREAGGRTTEH